MVRKGVIAINEIISLVITCTGSSLFICIHYSAIAGLCITAWERGIVFSPGHCNVLFAKSTMVRFKNKKMKKELIIKNELQNSFSIKARLKSFRYAFEGLN